MFVLIFDFCDVCCVCLYLKVCLAEYLTISQTYSFNHGKQHVQSLSKVATQDELLR